MNFFIIFHIFSLFSLYFRTFQQGCFYLNQEISPPSCFSCAFDYYKNVSFDWELADFDESLCLTRSPSIGEQEIYVNSSIIDCFSTICDGSLFSPFNDLFMVFESIMINNLEYFNSTITIFLFGDKAHYLYTNKTIDNPFYVFRRYYINFTIQPLLCQYKPSVPGCFSDEETMVDIFLKRSDILIFISNYMMLRNFRFNGIDLLIYSNLNDEQTKVDNL